jgi:hypothetical protein
MEDRVLNEALAGYAAAEPLAGLEERVLQRIRADRARRRFAWWACAAAAGAAALFVMLWVGTAPQTLALRALAPKAPAIARVAEVPRPATRRKPPKWREFPIPRPLSGQERALLALAAERPDLARQLAAHLDQPIQIDEIKIEPLNNDELNKER